MQKSVGNSILRPKYNQGKKEHIANFCDITFNLIGTKFDSFLIRCRTFNLYIELVLQWRLKSPL